MQRKDHPLLRRDFSGQCTHPHAWSTLHTSRIHCVKGAHTQRVDVKANRRIVFVRDDHLETNMHSASSDMEAADHHEDPRLGHSQLSTDIVPVSPWLS